jgi:predicted component of type VI protein secretion system
MTVGTLESNDVVVDADGVSRVHAVFERFGDTWFVRDLGSRNGTFVNGGKIIGVRALHAGDEILLGRLPTSIVTRSHRRSRRRLWPGLCTAVRADSAAYRSPPDDSVAGDEAI